MFGTYLKIELLNLETTALPALHQSNLEPHHQIINGHENQLGTNSDRERNDEDESTPLTRDESTDPTVLTTRRRSNLSLH